MLANKKINGFILLFFISYKRFQHASNKKIGKSMYSDFINILKGLISNCSGA
jgi:dimeric dUTPase (all-alpha-NTP-PPase superfamily)